MSGDEDDPRTLRLRWAIDRSMREQLRAKVVAVQQIHRRVESRGWRKWLAVAASEPAGYGPVCAECRTAWPCRTDRALSTANGVLNPPGATENDFPASPVHRVTPDPGEAL